MHLRRDNFLKVPYLLIQSCKLTNLCQSRLDRLGGAPSCARRVLFVHHYHEQRINRDLHRAAKTSQGLALSNKGSG